MVNPIFSVLAPGVRMVVGKCMLGVFNGTGSGKIIRVYRVFLLNNQTVAVTGLNNIFSLQRFSTGSGGNPVSPVKHDSLLAPSLPAQIVMSSNMSYTTDVTIRRVVWSSDEPIASDAATVDEIQTLPSLMNIWDCSYSYINESLEPLVLREGYGVGIVLDSSSSTPAVGALDVGMEMSIGSS